MNWFKFANKDKCKGWLAVRLKKNDVNFIQKWSKSYITEDMLYKKEGHGREEDSHITILYGICVEDPEIIKILLEDVKPLKVSFGKIGFFKSKDGVNPLIIKVESEDLEKLNEKIKKYLNVESTYKEYKPHCTIAYLNDGEAMQFAGDTYFDGMEFTFDEVVFVNNKKEEKTIKLKK